jgi:hypothetical protein
VTVTSVVSDEERQRSRRRDAGQLRVTERDLVVFRWLADMKACYDIDLQVLLGRLTGKRPGEAAVRALTRRWQALGVADTRKLIASEPRIVRLLPNGARLVGEHSFSETSAFGVYHQADVSRVRMYLERPGAPRGDIAEWISERQLRQQESRTFTKGAERSHVPDAVVIFGSGEQAALEVERSSKSNKRLREYIGQMSGYDLIVYAVPRGTSQIENAVKQAYETVRDAARSQGRTRFARLVLMDIPPELVE